MSPSVYFFYVSKKSQSYILIMKNSNSVIRLFQCLKEAYMSEEFNDYHIAGIQKNLDGGFVIKKSRSYTRAAVIGRPDIKGAMIVSLVEDLGDGRTGWLLHLHHGDTPKDLADGKVRLSGEEFRYYYWSDLLKGIKELSKEL